jgi:hypothetical protein
LTAWAGQSKYLDAIDDGKGILSNKLSSDELKAKFADANLAFLKRRIPHWRGVGDRRKIQE